MRKSNLISFTRGFLAALTLAAAAWAAQGGVSTTPRPASAAFPGANGKIVFSSNRNDGETHEIYKMNADGSGQTRLTNNAADDVTPKWSADGSRIVFSSERNGAGQEVYVMNADGTGQTRLTNNAADDMWPAWSPDGLRILFASDRDGPLSIFKMNADGSNQEMLATGGSYPAWSPDGSKIAFAKDSGSDMTEIYLMNPDGSGQVPLTNDGAANRSLDWSPDGSKIVFSGGGLDAWSRDVYVVSVSGGSETRLTNSGFADMPAWSPDGYRIVYWHNSAVWVMNADGTGQTQLTSGLVDDVSPDWQRLAALPVGGLAELSERDEAALNRAESSRSSSMPYVAVTAAIVVGAIILAGGGWYAKRRG